MIRLSVFVAAFVLFQCSNAQVWPSAIPEGIPVTVDANSILDSALPSAANADAPITVEDLALGNDTTITEEALSYNPRSWRPKIDSRMYNPDRVDWGSLISTCRAVFSYEKRFANFLIRAVFHDALTVDNRCLRLMVEGESNDNSTVADEAFSCGGLDGSLFTLDEVKRGENLGWSEIAASTITKIASLYDASLADTLAVCSAAAIEEASGKRYTAKILGKGGRKNFRVGRLDNMYPNPENLLIPPSSDLKGFVAFWRKLGFSIEEGVALMGSHNMLKTLGCQQSHWPGDDCDPSYPGTCRDVRMFKWSSEYYQSVCSPSIEWVRPYNVTPVARLGEQQYHMYMKEEMCRWTSTEWRKKSWAGVEAMRYGMTQQRPEPPVTVHWSNKGCDRRVNSWCPHREGPWPYTELDAWLGSACQGDAAYMDQDAQQVKYAMNRMKDTKYWDEVTYWAFQKMVNRFSKFGQYSFISGDECTSGYMTQDRQYGSAKQICSGCYNKYNGGYCHPSCVCVTSYYNGGARLLSVALSPAKK